MLQNPTPSLILASASRTRQTLLSAAGLQFTSVPTAVDEAGVKQAARADGADADATALYLAELKARRVAQRTPDALVIGADQILVCGESWFDKPVDLDAAQAQLAALRGKTHTLNTAVLCMRGSQRLWHHVSRPRLTMRAFSDQFLDDYLAVEADRALTSVGAYRLEGPGVHLFDRVEGDHATILGLPLLPLLGSCASTAC